ncbi:unnamed protein product, partial [marine sediment metagenome]
ADFLEAKFGERPKRILPECAAGPESERAKTDPWTVAVVILAVPNAILAATDLAKRLGIKQKAEDLISGLREIVTRHLEIRIYVSRKGRSIRADRAQSADIIQLAEPNGDEAKPQRKEKP